MKKTYVIAIIILILVFLYMMPSMSSYTSKAAPAAPCSCSQPQRDGVYMPSLIKMPDSTKDSREYTWNQ